jgi:signal transduction histidine kinase
MQHTPAGGAIRLTATAQGEQIMATVEDNGPGIAPEDLPHIFDRFYRSDRARTTGGQGHYGLGLSIARTIARAHGGDITAQSTLGKGGRFTVSLPRTDPPESSPL